MNILKKLGHCLARLFSKTKNLTDAEKDAIFKRSTPEPVDPHKYRGG